jgi:hypothetical protein
MTQERKADMKHLISMAAGVAALVLATAPPSQAAVIDNLGANPSSAAGNFENSPGSGAFDDQVLFQLVGGLAHLTIASVTNTFANPTDFIANFEASVYRIVGGIGGGDDVQVIGPVAASSNCGLLCQGMGGSAILASGNYYANFSGIAGATAGYAGNISTSVSAVPIPAALPLFATALAGMGALRMRRRRRVPTAA